MSKIETQLKHWLQLLDLPISAAFIRNQILAHPEYPSLLCITETLSNLGIENAAVQIEKTELSTLPTPFLAHTQTNGGEFIVVENVTKMLSREPGFMDKWSGIVVLAEKPAQFLHTENDRLLVKEKHRTNLIGIIIAFSILLSALCLLNRFSIVNMLLLITVMAGIATVAVIILHELGYENSITEQLCGAGDNIDCDAVLQAGKKMSASISFSDIGILYFLITWLLLIQHLLIDANFIGILSLFSSFSVPFIIFSVYYQWRIIKKWCILCLVCLSLLLIQFTILSLSGSLAAIRDIKYTEIYQTGIYVLLATSALIVVIKPLLIELSSQQETYWSLLRFKYSAESFKASLHQQRRVEHSSYIHDLELANPDAPLQLIIACNPYCKPCASTHHIIHTLIEKDPALISVILRFTFNNDRPEDRQLIAVKYMLQYIRETGYSGNKRVILVRTLLNDWFNEMNLDSFVSKYPVRTNPPVSDWLEDHKNWFNKSNVQSTPTIFINGYEFPKAYKRKDLLQIIPLLKDH